MTIHLIKEESHYLYKFYCNKELQWWHEAKQLPKHVYTDPDTSVKFTQHEYRTDCPDCLLQLRLEEDEESLISQDEEELDWSLREEL